MKRYTQKDIDDLPYYSKYNFIWDMMPGDEILIECNKEQIARIRGIINVTVRRHNPAAKYATRKNWKGDAYLIIRVK